MEIIFKSPKEHYTAQACIVWCFDDRFTGVLNTFLDAKGYNHRDLVSIAGGAKDLVSWLHSIRRWSLLRQIKISVKLHRAKTIVLMNHSECGAYGGREIGKEDLPRAKKYLQAKLPGIEIKTVFADFEKISEI